MRKLFFLGAAASLLSSCSVMMASKMDGVELDSIPNVRSRSELIALSEPIESRRNDEGERVEVYRILEQKGSIARAVMHGLLDISTGFLWELAGTPIESSLTQQKYISIKVTFDAEDQIKKMELL